MPGPREMRTQDRADSTGAEHGELKLRTGIFHGNSMPHNSEYLEYVLEQLAGLHGVVSRRMFSGAGLYQDDVFFALIFSDTLYFKVNDDTRPDYEARGMRRFQPYEDKPDLSFTYYEVPADVLEDREQLVVWARRSVQAAVATNAAKVARRAKSAGRKRKSKRTKLKRAKLEGPQLKSPKLKRTQPKRKAR
jgi:DNA transformation protein